jgi:two-component sensor histidine kinase
MNFTLRQRLLLLTALAVIPAFIIVAFNHYTSRAARAAEVDTYTLRMTDVVLNEVVRGLTAAATLMIAMGRSAIVEGEDAAACEEYTSSIQRDLVTITDIAVADADGVVYCHSGISERVELQKSVADLAVGEQQSLVVGNYTAAPGGAVLPIGLAQRDADGVVQGYIQLFVNMSELVRLVTGATAGVEDSRAVVTDRNGTVLLSLPDDLAKAGEPLPEYMAGFLQATEPGTLRFTTPDGTRRIVGYRPATESMPIGTIFSLPEGPMMAAIDRAGLTNSLIALTGALLAFLIAWFVGSAFIRRPVQALDGLVAARQAGDRQVRSGLHQDGSEFGRLGTSIDKLFDALDERDELQQRTAEQRDLFAREVQHRVKNLLSIIQIVAKQTLARPGASPEVGVFESRIRAIIQANAGLLAQTPYSGTMGELVQGAVTPFVGPDSHRVDVRGPEMSVHAKVGASLAMALHEMATNAVKYGSLSVPAGEVSIRWSASDGRFELHWIEWGGPPATTPTKSGFGNLLISRVLEAETRGSVSTEFTETGFRFHLQAPLENIGSEQNEGDPVAAVAE